MKKIVASFPVFFLFLSLPALYAQMPLGIPGAPGAPASLERIGVVAAAGGQVELTTPGQIGRIAKSGQPIFMGDLVKTDAKGHLQILLLDETVFTIGPNSAITIDKFVYDPKTQAGEIKASVSKGIFRYVSGRIALKNPDQVKVKLPTATLGFRGTFVGGALGANGQGLVGLLGPGNNNDSGSPAGGLTIEGQGGDTQDLDGTGFGVTIDENGNVSDPFRLTQEQVNNLSGDLTSSGGSGGNGGGGGAGDGEGGGGGLGGDNMDDLSGETGSLTGDAVGFTEGLSDLSNDLDTLTTFVSQGQNTTGSSSTTDGITSLTELASKTSGSYFYSVSGSFTQTLQDASAVNHTGTFSASWYANFADQRVDNIYVSIDTTSVGGNIDTLAEFDGDVPLTSVSFSGGSNGQAVFSTDNDGGSISAVITLKNSGSDIAHTGEIAVTYDNSGGSVPDDLGSGSGSAHVSEPG